MDVNNCDYDGDNNNDDSDSYPLTHNNVTKAYTTCLKKRKNPEENIISHLDYFLSTLLVVLSISMKDTYFIIVLICNSTTPLLTPSWRLALTLAWP